MKSNYAGPLKFTLDIPKDVVSLLLLVQMTSKSLDLKTDLFFIFLHNFQNRKDVTEHTQIIMLIKKRKKKKSFCFCQTCWWQKQFQFPECERKRRAPPAGKAIRTKLSIPSIAILTSQAATLRGNRVI